MEPIRFTKSAQKTTLVVNPAQILWSEFLDGKETKQITFHFLGDKTVSVTQKQLGDDGFEKLLYASKIKDPAPGCEIHK